MGLRTYRFGPLWHPVVIGLVLAHLMSPRDFGVLAVALIALFGMRSVDYLGMRRAIVACQDDPAEIVPTTMLLSLASGAAIYAASYVMAPAFAEDMGAPAAIPVIRYLALSVVSAPQRRLRPRCSSGVRPVCSRCWSSRPTTGSARLPPSPSFISGHGLMSLALGRIAGAAVAAILSAIFVPRALRIGFDPWVAQRRAPQGPVASPSPACCCSR